MPLETNAFPQDIGTGLGETVDFNNAAEFAQLAYDVNGVDYVVSGYDFTVDLGTNTLNVSEGVAKLFQSAAVTPDHSGEGGEASKEVAHTAFVAQRAASGDITLTDTAINYIYIGLDQTTQNRVIYQVNTTQTPPAEPYLLLGTVDTSAATPEDAITELNRLPEVNARRVVIE